MPVVRYSTESCGTDRCQGLRSVFGIVSVFLVLLFPDDKLLAIIWKYLGTSRGQGVMFVFIILWYDTAVLGSQDSTYRHVWWATLVLLGERYLLLFTLSLFTLKMPRCHAYC